MPTADEVAMHLFLQLGVILVTYRLLWPVFRRLGQVQVVAIMVAGFMLGPSLLGELAPGVQDWLFPRTVDVAGSSTAHPSLTVLYAVGQLGLVLYMFVVGCSFDTEIFVRHVRHAAVTSLVGVGVPVVAGGAVGWYLASNDELFPADVARWQAGLLIAAAIAITAFPMLAWIIYDSGLQRTRVGTLALACAAADDAVAWVLLAAVVASTKDNASDAVLAAVGGVCYVLVMFTVVRRVLRRAFAWVEASDGARAERGQMVPLSALTLALAVMLAGAWFTDWAGVYSVFGAFVAGVVMPRGLLIDAVRRYLEPLTSYLLLPAFFIYSGLNTYLNVLVDPGLLGIFLLVLVVAFAAKGLAVGLSARLQGFDWYEAGSLGALMNARGLMELILLNIGVNAGIVTPQLYTIMALMAVVTTFVATPLHSWIDRRRPEQAPSAPEGPSSPGIDRATSASRP